MNNKTKIYKAGRRNIEISNPDKILFPSIDFSKYDLVNYYGNISFYILPHLKGRPLNMKRAPDGIEGKSFYQQDAGSYFSTEVDRARVKKKDNGIVTHIVCNKRSTLVLMANLACITIHIWSSKTGSIEKPDKMIFDLDPPENGFGLVRSGALKLKEYFDERSISSFVMTTGSKGLHVVIPIKPDNEFKKIREYARRVGEELSDKYPGKFTIEQSIKKRKGRLFMDYMRNSYGVTSVCPYSVRLLPHAPVAAPLYWDELRNKKIKARSWTVSNIFKRLDKKGDPWKDFSRHRVDIIKHLE
jgi:bifunctional non-homologous end joining protein LigD